MPELAIGVTGLYIRLFISPTKVRRKRFFSAFWPAKGEWGGSAEQTLRSIDRGKGNRYGRRGNNNRKSLVWGHGTEVCICVPSQCPIMTLEMRGVTQKIKLSAKQLPPLCSLPSFCISSSAVFVSSSSSSVQIRFPPFLFPHCASAQTKRRKKEKKTFPLTSGNKEQLVCPGLLHFYFPLFSFFPHFFGGRRGAGPIFSVCRCEKLPAALSLAQTVHTKGR